MSKSKFWDSRLAGRYFFAGCVLIAIVGFLGVGCDQAPPDPRLIVPDKSDNRLVEGRSSKRWKVESQGYFNGGYRDNPREIFVITDHLTGTEYLAVTGCGVTEIVREKQGKSTVDREE